MLASLGFTAWGIMRLQFDGTYDIMGADMGAELEHLPMIIVVMITMSSYMMVVFNG